MKKFVSILLVVLLIGSFAIAEEKMAFPVSISIEAITGSEPIVSSRDLIGEAIEAPTPARSLTFIENGEEVIIQWAREDGKFEYWQEPANAFSENVDENTIHIAVCTFAEMCDGYYTVLFYVDNNSTTYTLSPVMEQNVEENIFTNYEDFQIYVMMGAFE